MFQRVSLVPLVAFTHSTLGTYFSATVGSLGVTVNETLPPLPSTIISSEGVIVNVTCLVLFPSIFSLPQADEKTVRNRHKIQ